MLAAPSMSMTVPSVVLVELSVNVTVPVGVPDAPLPGLTVAVKVTACPGVLGSGVEVSLVVVAFLPTVNGVDPELGLNVALPL